MPKITQLQGKYQIKGNTLSNLIHKFLVVERKETTQKKGKNFLLHIDNKGKREYISSLYTTTTNKVFKFDYYDKEYRLILDEQPLILIVE
jgi:stalled ribosome alternative rescue factor ArfA